MYSHIIFDIDGTILDTEFAIMSSLQKLLAEELNREFSFEELKFAFGIPGEVTLKKLGIADTIYCLEKWNKYIQENFHYVKVFDDVKAAVVKLNEMGVKTGIVTSKTKEEFTCDFVPFELTDYFNIVVCADDTDKHKPDPDPILKFIEITGRDKSEYIYIGDTKYDMDCAHSAGIAFALALWGAKTSTDIDAEYILKNPEEILKL